MSKAAWILNRTLCGLRAHFCLQPDLVPRRIRTSLIQPPHTWFHSSLCETISLEKSCCWESRSLSWGQPKKVLLGLGMTSAEREALVRGLGICSVPWPRFSPEAAGSLGSRRSNEGLAELLLWVLASILPSWLVMSSLPIWWGIPSGRRKWGVAKGDPGSDIFRINTQLGYSSPAVHNDLTTFPPRTKVFIKKSRTDFNLRWFLCIQFLWICLVFINYDSSHKSWQDRLFKVLSLVSYPVDRYRGPGDLHETCQRQSPMISLRVVRRNFQR